MTPTREQVYAAVEAYGSQLDIVPTIDGITDAVMDALCDIELDAEGELREQLTARYEQRLAQALAEAPQPKVLTVEEATSLVIPEGHGPWQWAEPIQAIIADSWKWRSWPDHHPEEGPWGFRVAQSAIQNLYRYGPFAVVVVEDTAPPTEVTHACPPGDAACTPCCGRTPFELPRTDRLTLDPSLVTCREDTAPPVTEDPEDDR